MNRHEMEIRLLSMFREFTDEAIRKRRAGQPYDREIVKLGVLLAPLGLMVCDVEDDGKLIMGMIAPEKKDLAFEEFQRLLCEMYADQVPRA